MTVELVSAYAYRGAKTILYKLLEEREPDESISHSEMPTWDEHCFFFDSQPYIKWWIAVDHHEPVGCAYLTDRNEIGISVFRHQRRKGYASQIIQQITDLHVGPFFANINPDNDKSQKLFHSLGFDLVQFTLKKNAA